MRKKKEIKQGQYKVKHKVKYKGNPDNVYYRSSWELYFMYWLDTNDTVLEWKSEEVIVPYISPVDEKYHRYFVDFWAKMKTKNGPKEFLIEIKPKNQTMPPKPQKRTTKQYIDKITTWSINEAKWKYAQEYAEQNNMIFQILTEDQLFKHK